MLILASGRGRWAVSQKRLMISKSKLAYCVIFMSELCSYVDLLLISNQSEEKPILFIISLDWSLFGDKGLSERVELYFWG